MGFGARRERLALAPSQLVQGIPQNVRDFLAPHERKLFRKLLDSPTSRRIDLRQQPCELVRVLRAFWISALIWCGAQLNTRSPSK
jgi:hypothetical protein